MVRYCIAYARGQRLGEIDIEQIKETLEQEDTFIRLALHEPNEKLLLTLKEEFDLHELAIEDARAAHQRPKLEQYGKSLFIVLQTAMLWDDRVELGETHMFLGPRFLSPSGTARRSATARSGNAWNARRSAWQKGPPWRRMG